MSRTKRANGADSVYTNHLRGSQFKTNTATDSEALHEMMYERILTELSVNRFKWTGLPDEISVRWMELNLFYQALSVFFYDDKYEKYMALQGGGTNYLNMLNDPTAFVVIGQGTYGSKNISARDCVPVWANMLRRPDLDIVRIYSKKLASMDRTIEINALNARQTKVLVSGENQRLSVANINRQVEEGQNSVSIAGPLGDLAFIQALDLGVNPDTIEKLDIVRARQWNVCMGLLGIENANQDKKERLVGGEVDANNGQTQSMRFVHLNERRKAADAINKKYGLSVTVDFYTEAERKEELAAALAAETATEEPTEDEE